MLELKLSELPESIQNIDSPPVQLFYAGTDLLKLLKMPCVAIVGTRNPTTYGQRTAEDLASQLAQQGLVIISGLAYGVDAIAHQAALEVGGKCIAVLPSPLDNVLPMANRDLAEDILAKGGTLVSEYASGMPPAKQNFIARNRLMSGLADGVIIIEAAEKSGTLHTAQFAINQGRRVMAVPADIYKQTSFGCNNLIKTSQADLITSHKDVMSLMGLNDHSTPIKKVKGRNQNEQRLLDLMLQGISDADKLLEAMGLEVPKFNQTLIMLEISGKVRPLGANHWAIA